MEWVTYDSSYPAGIKPFDTTEGLLQSHYLSIAQFDRDYGYDAAGQLVRISEPLQQIHYQYPAGRLRQIQLTPDGITLDKLFSIFEIKDDSNVSADILTQYEGEVVYNYFNGKT